MSAIVLQLLHPHTTLTVRQNSIGCNASDILCAHQQNTHCHCTHKHSDGVGRTGTFICIHSQLERLKAEGEVDIFQSIKSARIQRAGLVLEEVRPFSCMCICFVVLIKLVSLPVYLQVVFPAIGFQSFDFHKLYYTVPLIWDLNFAVEEKMTIW